MPNSVHISPATEHTGGEGPMARPLCNYLQTAVWELNYGLGFIVRCVCLVRGGRKYDTHTPSKTKLQNNLLGGAESFSGGDAAL